MTIRLPALPALVAARALQDDAGRAARRALDQVQQLLGCYDLALSVVAELPAAARDGMTRTLHKRLVATERAARAAQQRLEEVQAFCASFRRTASPVAMVEVSGTLFEMLSPYLDDAMAPLVERISRRAGTSAEEVGRYFPAPRPAFAA
jgi:hypothetical protein